MFDLIAAHAPGLWHAANLTRLAVEVPLLRGGSLYRGPATRNAVALTFDDGPDPRWTPRILTALDRVGARATFFFLGEAMKANPTLTREVAAHHQIGTHLYDHSLAPMRSPAAFASEVARTFAVHEALLGERPSALRFPHGYAGRIGRKQLATYGLRAFHWTFSSEDARAADGSTVVERVRLRLAPGCIVLLHDGRGAGSTQGPGHREATVAAVPEILAAAAARGLAVVTLDQLCPSSA